MSATKTLSKRDAALRAKAVREILRAAAALSDIAPAHCAFRCAVWSRPRAALRSIARAEARLAKAKAALREWAR